MDALRVPFPVLETDGLEQLPVRFKDQIEPIDRHCVLRIPESTESLAVYTVLAILYPHRRLSVPAVVVHAGDVPDVEDAGIVPERKLRVEVGHNLGQSLHTFTVRTSLSSHSFHLDITSE